MKLGARYYDPDIGRFISQDSYLGESGTPPSLHRYLYAYGNPTVWIDPNGNISWMANTRDWLKNWAQEKYEFTESLNNSDSDWKFLEAGLVGIGVGMGDLAAGAMSTANYAGNWLSMATGGFGNDDWGMEHAAEIEASHHQIGAVYNTLRSEEGRQQIAFAAFETIEGVIEGDTGAVAKTTGLFGELGAGGAVSKVSGTGVSRFAKVAQPKMAGMKQVAKKTADAIKTNAPKITGEVKDAIVENGKAILQETRRQIDPTISPFDYAKTFEFNSWKQFRKTFDHKQAKVTRRNAKDLWKLYQKSPEQFYARDKVQSVLRLRGDTQPTLKEFIGDHRRGLEIDGSWLGKAQRWGEEAFAEYMLDR